MSRLILRYDENRKIKGIMIVDGPFDEKIYDEQLGLGKSHEKAYLAAGGTPMPEGMDNYFTENWRPYRIIE